MKWFARAVLAALLGVILYAESLWKPRGMGISCLEFTALAFVLFGAICAVLFVLWWLIDKAVDR